MALTEASPRSEAQVDSPKRSMLSRGLSIVDSFGGRDHELSLSELARRADLPKPTAHRLVAELLEWGILERGRSGLRLGPRLAHFGARVHRHDLLRTTALPHLRRLCELTGGRAVLSVTKHDQLIHLARCGNPSAKNASRDVADERLSIAATRRLMRALDPSTDYAGSGAEIVRSQQYAAVAHGSGERTLLGIACPISIEQRPPVATVTALATRHRGSLATIVAPVQACALSITRAIRAMPEFY